MLSLPPWLIFFWLLSWLVLPVVITKKKRPVHALAWMMAVVFLPVLGAILFFVFGTDRIVNKGRRKIFSNEKLRDHFRRVEAAWAFSKWHDSEKKLPKTLEDVARICRKFGLFDAVGNNEVKILTEVRGTYDMMEEAIRSAEHHINCEYYIFRPDLAGARFRDLLIEKARQGVRVNFLYDAIGSRKLGWDRKFLTRFQEAGIEPRDFLPLRTFFKPWNINLRNHRKIIVIDNRIGFTGSLNIGRDFLARTDGKKFRETHIMVQGPVVDHLQWIFCEDWYFATGKILLPEFFLPVEAAGDEIAQVVASGPDAREEAIHKAFVLAISQAQKSIYLTTPYFIPGQALNLALQLAALRGVDVRLLVPRQSDHLFVLLAGRSYYDVLLQNGVRIFEYMPSILHAKMLVVDGHFTVIGSANADLRSMSYNFEVNVQVYGAAFAQQAEAVFLADLEQSREIDAAVYLKRPATVRFRENVCRLLSPLL